MAKTIMVQGTSSDVGKSIITTGLCRILANQGYKVAPFKSQNMSRNAFTMENGKIISKSIAIQAYASKAKASTNMNPIVLIPEDDMGSQIVVNGEKIGAMKAQEYYKWKDKYGFDIVKTAFDKLAQENDIIVLEGAGSPAEINLKENDIVNMGMAKLAKSPVILVGDIDRGGVFASIAGTLMLLEQEERDLVKGVLINKFRGDIALLKDGIEKIEEIIQKDVLGVVPYLDIDIEKEDSLSLGSNDFQSERYTDDYIDKNIEKLAKGLQENLDMHKIAQILKAGIENV